MIIWSRAPQFRNDYAGSNKHVPSAANPERTYAVGHIGTDKSKKRLLVEVTKKNCEQHGSIVERLKVCFIAGCGDLTKIDLIATKERLISQAMGK